MHVPAPGGTIEYVAMVRSLHERVAMKTLVLALLTLAAVPRIAAADGWIHCSGPDAPNGCSPSGVDSASVGAGLLVIGAVVYGIARRKRR